MFLRIYWMIRIIRRRNLRRSLINILIRLIIVIAYPKIMLRSLGNYSILYTLKECNPISNWMIQFHPIITNNRNLVYLNRMIIILNRWIRSRGRESRGNWGRISNNLKSQYNRIREKKVRKDESDGDIFPIKDTPTIMKEEH